VASFVAVLVLAVLGASGKAEGVVGDDVLIFRHQRIAEWIAREAAGGISPDDLCDRRMVGTARREAEVLEPCRHSSGIVGQPMGRHRPDDEWRIAEPMSPLLSQGHATQEFVLHVRDQL
jgi:hypothetical protein